MLGCWLAFGAASLAIVMLLALVSYRAGHGKDSELLNTILGWAGPHQVAVPEFQLQVSG